MRDLVITDASMRDVLIPRGATLDLAFGADENDFELVLPTAEGTLGVGQRLYFAGTEWGGVIDSREFSSAGSTALTYRGRTWHGVLAGSVLCPDPGADYLRYSGDLNSIISTVVARQGLGGLFDVPSEGVGITASGQFDRYTDAYSGLTKVLASKGCKLVMRAEGHRVSLRAERVSPVRLDTDEYDLTVAEGRYTNHLVCLGSGELKDRIVVHLYADAAGNVSTTRTFSGIDEIAETYDYSNAEATELTTKGTERLREMFADACGLTVADDLGLDVGDVVVAASVESGIEVEATVTKVVVKVQGRQSSVSYEVGNLTRRA